MPRHSVLKWQDIKGREEDLESHQRVNTDPLKRTARRRPTSLQSNGSWETDHNGSSKKSCPPRFVGSAKGLFQNEDKISTGCKTENTNHQENYCKEQASRKKMMPTGWYEMQEKNSRQVSGHHIDKLKIFPPCPATQS